MDMRYGEFVDPDWDGAKEYASKPVNPRFLIGRRVLVPAGTIMRTTELGVSKQGVPTATNQTVLITDARGEFGRGGEVYWIEDDGHHRYCLADAVRAVPR
jgi:hypothetical protein